MKKKVIRLTESQLDKIVKSVLNESYSGGIIQRGDGICEIICKRKLAMYGSNGDVVKMIQHLLYVNQYNTKYSGGGMNGDWCYSDWTKCDGLFKNQTQTAVEEFQSKNGLTVDGKVGYNTWKAMCESKIFIFSKSLPKNVFCKVCNCKDNQQDDNNVIDNDLDWESRRKKIKDEFTNTPPDFNPIKIVDGLDCVNIKDCMKKYLFGVTAPDYTGFMGCINNQTNKDIKLDYNKEDLYSDYGFVEGCTWHVKTDVKDGYRTVMKCPKTLNCMPGPGAEAAKMLEYCYSNAILACKKAGCTQIAV